jgi:hypothetical protein
LITTALLPQVLIIGLMLGSFLWGGATEPPGSGAFGLAVTVTR